MTAVYGRVGRAALKPVYARQQAKTRETRVWGSLKIALIWLRRVLRSAPPRPVPLLEDVFPERRLWVDAAGDGWLAAVFRADRDSPLLYTRVRVPDHLIGWLRPRSNYIKFLEVAAAFLGLATFRQQLHASLVVLFCDNRGQEGILRKGFSSAWDIAVLSGIFWELAALERVDVFVERVPSEENVADYPTRMNDEACRRAVAHVFAMQYVEPRGVEVLEQVFQSLFEHPNDYPEVSFLV